MTAQEVYTLLFDRYIRPTERKREEFIGVEIELPIVNLSGEAVDFAVVHALTAAFLKEFGFTATGIDEEGHVYAAVREQNGDVFSYDCSYNNMEFSFGRERSLREIDARFLTYYRFVQKTLAPHGYTLTGMGINPNRRVNHNLPIENGRYKMLFHHLSSFENYEKLPMYFHRYPHFGMFSSASQVQLDVSRGALAETIHVFNQLEPIKALLFSNSVLLGENEDLLCCRDMLWENSTHGINPHNVGMYDCDILSEQDVLRYLSTTSIYCAEREGKYLSFPPLNVLDYFSRGSVTGEYVEDGELRTLTFAPRAEDIAYLRTFKFEDLTFRGTIEFRSACCQPVSEAMTVAAFHVGLLHKTAQLSEIIRQDTSLYHNGYNAAELRRQLVRRELPAYIDRDRLYRLAKAVLDLCREGLRERGFGEEAYLAPLDSRVAAQTNPAKEMLGRLNAGESLQSIVRRYGEIEK